MAYIFVNLLIFFIGAAVVILTMLSAIRTVVVPRGERVLLTRMLFSAARYLFEMGTEYMKDYESRDAFLARFAPTTLLLLPIVWAGGVLFGFAAMFWSIGTRPLSHTIELSGSSLTTLGFHVADNHWELSLAVVEALIGLGLVALLISFLPSIYTTFREREMMCTRWNIRAGSPPDLEIAVRRFHEVEMLGHMDETWLQWENWFVSNEESHISYPSLVFFRSTTPYQSWITTAGNVLDTAAFVESAVDVPHSPNARLCLRAGHVALRNILEYYRTDAHNVSIPDVQITVPQEEFNEVFDKLKRHGIPMVEDREQAWRDFSGWRVNYDVPLRLLCGIVDAPYAKWSSDFVEDLHGQRRFPTSLHKLFQSKTWREVKRRDNQDIAQLNPEEGPRMMSRRERNKDFLRWIRHASKHASDHSTSDEKSRRKGKR